MKNACYKISLIIYLWILLGHIAFGQSYNRISTDDAFVAMEKLFESNHTLVNGVFFVDKYRNDIGYPFLKLPYFTEGTFGFNNTEYTDCKLAYNLVEQKIVVVEKKDIKTENPFIPPVEFITGFKIEDKKFINDTHDNRFYQQVFESEQFNVLAYLYKKAAKSYHKKNILAYKYSDIITDIFVVIDNNKFEITTKRNYLSLFPSELAQALSSYIKRNKINFKKSDISELNKLFNYTQNIIEENKISLMAKKTHAQ